MDIFEANKLVLFIAFVVPGFISLKTYSVAHAGAPRDTGQQLIDAVAYSSINYALLLWPIYEVESRNIRTHFPREYVAFYVFVLLIAPVLWALIWRTLRKTQAFQKLLPHPTEKPWDFLFRQRKPYWAIVTFKDGRRIAGRYDASSFASSSPAPEQIYLEEAWELNADGGFERQRTDTAGIMVLGAEVVTIEFFKVEQGETDEHEQASTPEHSQEGVATGPTKT